MTRDEIIKALKKDEVDENGEIVEITEKGVLYYDYENCETFYRFPESCTRKEITPLFFICGEANKRGLTPDFLFDMLQEVFKEDFADAMCTLNGIIVADMKNFLHLLCQVDTHEGSDMNEFYGWESLDNCVGRTLNAHKIAVVNHQEIAEQAKLLADEIFTEDEEYATGIIQTVIHEVRHLMIDTNPFLSIDTKEESEESVEEFCRIKYDDLPEELKYF